MTNSPTPSNPGDSASSAPQRPGGRFDPSKPHLNRPKVRPLRGMPVQGQLPNGQTVPMLGLMDARQVSDKMLVLAPAAQHILALLDGSNTLSDIVGKVGRGLTDDVLRDIVMQLDDAAFLEGPNFEALMRQTREAFDASDALPPGSTEAFADALVEAALGKDATPEQKAEQGPRRLREMMDQWMAKSLEKVDKPSLDALPKAIVAPHLDYQRGWINYAHIYGRLRVCERPARVVILGTNHFGFGTGVVGCNKGFTTPLGTSPVDEGLLNELRATLGDKLFEHRTDHEREHSIELQVPWIQHVFGQDPLGRFVPVFGALVHDPAANNGRSYDGSGVDFEPFVQALKGAIARQPGPTLIVSSADLSHVGPAFGDQKPLVGDAEDVVNFRNSVHQHDLACLKMLTDLKPNDLVASIAWQQNPTRWCSVGNLVATMMVAEPSKVDLLNYGAAMDQGGSTMVSSAAMVMM